MDSQAVISTIRFNEITAKSDLQARSFLNEAVAKEYAEAMLSGAMFPPIHVFWDGETYYLVDGFHRYHAARLAKIEMMDCVVHTGDYRQARLYAFGSQNSDHGLRRTPADKRYQVKQLLLDEEWGSWSNWEIARHASVSHTFVANLRQELVGEGKIKPSESVTYQRNGKVQTMHVVNMKSTSSWPAADEDEELYADDSIDNYEDEGEEVKPKAKPKSKPQRSEGGKLPNGKTKAADSLTSTWGAIGGAMATQVSRVNSTNEKNIADFGKRLQKLDEELINTLLARLQDDPSLATKVAKAMLGAL